MPFGEMPLTLPKHTYSIVPDFVKAWDGWDGLDVSERMPGPFVWLFALPGKSYAFECVETKPVMFEQNVVSEEVTLEVSHILSTELAMRAALVLYS